MSPPRARGARTGRRRGPLVGARVFATMLGGVMVLGLSLRSELALAHAVGLSTATYRVHGTKVMADLAFAQADVIGLAREADASGDGVVSAVELTVARPALAALAVEVVVRGDGVACPGILQDASLIEDDGVRLALRFTCARAPEAITFHLPLLERLAHGHRHLITLATGAPGAQAVLQRDQPTATVTLTSAPSRGTVVVGDLIVLGIEHILTGFDHLIFLLGLLLLRGRVVSLVKTVTAFTIGHSLSLAVGALGWWTPDPRWVEPLIALSVVYVGVENFFVRDGENRWRITLPFGLVHGFGFAGILRELSFGGGDLVAALLSFNLGVEVGQLAVLALWVPLVQLAYRSAVFARYGVPAVSAAVVVPGLVWFVSRVTAG